MDELLRMRIAIEGADDAVRWLQRIGNAAEDTAAKSRRMDGVGKGLLTGAAALGALSVKSYESVERLRRSMVSLAGEAKGAALAKQITAFASQANASNEALGRMAQTWLGVTEGDTTKALDFLKAMERLQNATSMESGRLMDAGRTVAQIYGATKFTADQASRLGDNGVPTSAAAEALGLKNIQAAVGRPGKEVGEAILKGLNRLPTFSPLGTQRAENVGEALMQALRPTGERIEAAMAPLLSGAETFAGWLKTINEGGQGWPGLVLVVGLAAGGFRVLRRAVLSPITALSRLRGSADAAANALDRIGRAGTGRGGGSGGGGGMVPAPSGSGGGGGAAGGAAGAAGASRMFRLGSVLGRAVGYARAGAAAAARFALPYAAAVGAGVLGTGYALHRLAPKSFKNPFGVLQEHYEDMRSGDPDWMLQRGDARRRRPASSPSPISSAATRPLRRGSIEAIMHDRFTIAHGGA